MHPMFIVAIPLVLVIVGMVLNSIGLGFNQPPSSSEQDPAKKAAAEREDYRRFFDLQRRQAVKRQTRVGQYAWLLMIAIIGSFIWLYMYTVKEHQRRDSSCHAANLGDGRGERHGSFDHSEGRQQCQIYDQITPSRRVGSRQERRHFK